MRGSVNIAFDIFVVLFFFVLFVAIPVLGLYSYITCDEPCQIEQQAERRYERMLEENNYNNKRAQAEEKAKQLYLERQGVPYE